MWKFEKQKTTYPNAAFKTISEHDKTETNLKNEIYHSSLRNETPDFETTNKIIKEFKLKTGQELTEIENITDELLLPDVFRKNVEKSPQTFDERLLTSIWFSENTYACALFKTTQQIVHLKREVLFLPVGKNIKRGVSGIFWP